MNAIVTPVLKMGHPTLESHVEKIRAMYEVVDREVAK